jgi:serine/threonine protein kinase
MTDRAEAAISKAAGPDPLIGRLINDRFKIVSLIARGGMGKVYRAEQAPLGRACALKVLNPNYSGEHDPEFHKRFFLEASMTSKLTHPNTVTIFDYGRADDDIYYMAMEYLDGHTLHRAIRHAGHFPEERAAHVARQICRALREAHSLGIIHRDLKPANVYLVEHGDEPDFVKVLDFGLVKNVADASGEELTQAGLFMGSPKYMAPEQVNGDRVDARTDIYALGVILYEMLTGKVPFDSATSVSILMAQVKEAAAPMKKTNPSIDVSVAMEDTVARCMAKSPDDRFRSMDEVLAALRRVASSTLSTLSTGASPGGAGTDSPAHSTTGSGPLPPSSPSGSNAGRTSGAQTGSGSNPSNPHAGTLGGSSTGTISEVGSFPSPLSVTSGSSGGPASNSPLTSTPPPRAGSKGMLVAAVLGALAVAGTIAFVSMRPGAGAAGGQASPTVSPSMPAPATPPPALPAAPALAKVRVNSDPDGASVKEDGVELCTSTPCDILYKGPDADAAREHKLTVSRQGYKSESRSIRVGDSPVVVKLAKADLPRVVPQAAQPPRNDTPPTVPTGYKNDVPY